jgi:hypothetical protein
MKNLIEKLTKKILRETIEDKTSEVMEKLKFNKPGESFDYVEEGETCEQCGGEMKEGEMCECGSKMMEGEMCEQCGGEMKEGEVCEQCGGGEVMEKLYGKQKKLDKAKPFGKLTKADFDKLRKESVSYSLEIDGDEVMMTESEFNRFIMNIVEKEKNKTPETKYKLEIGGRGFIVSEEKLLDIIEKAVLKEESNITKGKTPKGYGEYERSVKKSKKENDDYLSSVKKKMSDYLKDGSKGDYDTNPDFFPKGNGQLEKMKAKKYTMSDEGKEFLDDYMRPGMENLVPDEIEYDEKWVGDNIKGSSRTGNNPKWANAEETDLGEKLTKKMKDKKYNKAKMAAYRKSKQPVTDGTGENSGSGVNIKVESDLDRKRNLVLEEFSKIQKLINYDKRTQ